MGTLHLAGKMLQPLVFMVHTCRNIWYARVIRLDFHASCSFVVPRCSNPRRLRGAQGSSSSQDGTSRKAAPSLLGGNPVLRCGFQAGRIEAWAAVTASVAISDYEYCIA